MRDTSVAGTLVICFELASSSSLATPSRSSFFFLAARFSHRYFNDIVSLLSGVGGQVCNLALVIQCLAGDAGKDCYVGHDNLLG